uniref:Uncharacterized protein n=1 Tax=Oryza glaberrima TaxID=4538 RepID=I1QGY4_ORYGL
MARPHSSSSPCPCQGTAPRCGKNEGGVEESTRWQEQQQLEEELVSVAGAAGEGRRGGEEEQKGVEFGRLFVTFALRLYQKFRIQKLPTGSFFSFLFSTTAFDFESISVFKSFSRIKVKVRI